MKPGDVVVEFDKTKTEQDLAQYQSTSEIGRRLKLNRPGRRRGWPKKKIRPRC